MKKSRVTTKHGDGGKTRALDGAVLPKDHPVMQAVGAIDELRARTAMLRIALLEVDKESTACVEWLMHALFPIGTACSDPERKKPEYWAVELSAKHLEKLEADQARLEAIVDWPKSFVAGATSREGAMADLAATAARDAERRIAALAQEVPAFDTSVIQPFVNRLSDYFFVLGRHLDKGDHMPVDYTLLND